MLEPSKEDLEKAIKCIDAGNKCRCIKGDDACEEHQIEAIAQALAELRAEGESFVAEAVRQVEASDKLYRQQCQKINTLEAEKSAIEKEKAGLEERVRELEGDKNILELQVSAKRETWESQTVDRLEKKLEYYQSQFNRYHTLAEKVTLENERLKAENAELHKINTRDNTYLTSKESELKSQVDRLSASLAAAHGALEKVRVWGGSIVRIFDRELIESDHPKIFSQIDEILSDPSGSVAFEKWKKMGAVVEAARACYEEDDFITENSPGSFERDKKLGEALEALEAKGGVK